MKKDGEHSYKWYWEIVLYVATNNYEDFKIAELEVEVLAHMFKILNEIVKISIIIVSFFFFFFKIYCFIFPISKVVI